jgi:hypothetical protein
MVIGARGATFVVITLTVMLRLSLVVIIVARREDTTFPSFTSMLAKTLNFYKE